MTYPNDPGNQHWNQGRPPTGPGGSPHPYGNQPPYANQAPYGNPQPPDDPYAPTSSYQQPDPYGYVAPGYPGYGQQPPGYGGPQPQGGTNGLAIAALISAFIVAPVGIVLGHFSLSEIKRNHQKGGPLAIAALVIGYLFTVVGVVALVLVLTGAIGSGDDEESTTAAGKSSTTNESTTETTETTETSTTYSYPSSTYTYSTTAEPGVTSPPAYTPDPSNTIANEIRTTDVGACIHREANGSQLTTFYRTSCGSSAATDRVYLRTDNTSSCNGNWVQIGPSSYFRYNVVLCLTPL